MIRKVYLLGNLGEKFGPVWNVHCTTVSECLRLIECQADGFKKYLIDIVNQGTNFAVRTGEELLETGEQLYMNLNAEDVYITEVPAGSGGLSKIIVGALMIIAAVTYVAVTGDVLTGAKTLGAAFASLTPAQTFFVVTAFSIGLNLVMAGVNELLMPKVDKGKSEGSLFSGPINTVKQGQPVPLLYGELIVGGAPISVSFTKTSIGFSGFAFTGPIFSNIGAALVASPGAYTNFTGGTYSVDALGEYTKYTGA